MTLAPLRIQFLTTSLMRGGAEIQVMLLACALKERGHEVEVISMIEPEALTEELAAKRIPVVSLRMKQGHTDPGAVFRLRHHIHKFEPDVVHSHMVHANLLARVTRLITRMPVLISTAHSTHEGSRLFDLAYRFTDRLATLTTNVSAAAVQRYVEARLAPENRIRIMPNGIHTDTFCESPLKRDQTREVLRLGSSFCWLAAGALHESKDYPTLLQAFALVIHEKPGVRLLIAGEGPELAKLKQLIMDLHLTDNVTLLGLRSDIAALMNAADAYVMSSVWEGLPLVLLEAAASSLPMVVTRVGGNAEIVEEAANGSVVPASDPYSLAAAMLQLQQAPAAERAGMGERGRTLVTRKYEIGQVAPAWLDVYRELLGSRQRSLA